MTVPLWFILTLVSFAASVGFGVGLLCKTITDGIGKWVADCLTDRRRDRKEASRKEAAERELLLSLGGTFDNIRLNLQQHPEVRDIIIAPKGLCYSWPGSHIQFDEVNEDRLTVVNHFRLLEEGGYVVAYHDTDLDAYRITESFARFVLR